MKQNIQVLIWMVWLLVWPTSLFLVYIYTEPEFHVQILLFALLASIVALFPIVINERPIFFTYGIAFAVFLSEGLFYEIAITQLGLWILLYKIKLRKEEWYRVPLNMLMFLMISLGAAFVYYQLGGVHGREILQSPQAIGAAVAYAFVQIALNQALVKAISNWLYKKHEPWVTLGDVWEYFTSLAILPLGFLLFVLYVDIGIQALLFVGFPFLIVSATLRYLHHSRIMNGYLRKSGEIGQELASFARVEQVLDIFTKRVKPLFEADILYILDVEGEETLSLIRKVDGEGMKKNEREDVTDVPSISRETWKNKKGYVYRDRRFWNKSMERYKEMKMESAMTVPMFRFGEVVGIITLFSSRKRNFSQAQFQLLKILSNYLAIAIENARVYEKLKDGEERCGLTGAYNYRYLEQTLASYGSDSLFTVIMMDLDHFKSINDKYGHESGNEILVQLVNRLVNQLESSSLVARYGGEEFVVVFENLSEEEAIIKAEDIRELITKEPFFVHRHIGKENGPLEVKLTASIGVATYPIHGNCPEEILQKADEAMYKGAKQKGRDRVAVVEI